MSSINSAFIDIPDPIVAQHAHASRSPSSPAKAVGANALLMRGWNRSRPHRSTPMARSVLALFAFLSAFLGGFIMPGSAETIRFTGETSDAPPPNFEFGRTGGGGPGRWAVVRDDKAEGGFAVEQQSQDPTDFRFPLAIYQPLSAKNVDVQIRFKPLTGKIDRAGGIAVRLTSADNYYVVRANALEDNVRFYRMIAGKREQLATANVKVPSNEWHALGLKAEGNRFTITFNAEELYAVTDKTFEAAGRVALWTKADSVTRFDRLDIRTLP
jgi:Galactocerebrosidase, C-terminal lectin domain